MTKNPQLLSNRQFATMIVLTIVVVIFIYILAFINQSAVGWQFSDIFGILIDMGIANAPFVLFPGAIVSFIYLNWKRNRNMRWPITLLGLGVFCLLIRMVLFILF